MGIYLITGMISLNDLTGSQDISDCVEYKVIKRARPRRGHRFAGVRGQLEAGRGMRQLFSAAHIRSTFFSIV